LFHARAESVADNPIFRDAFKRHRCIIPANGYYEWITRPDGKQPHGLLQIIRDSACLGQLKIKPIMRDFKSGIDFPGLTKLTNFALKPLQTLVDLLATL
jgi:hypothetical protein